MVTKMVADGFANLLLICYSSSFSFDFMARPEGFEPTTLGSEVRLTNLHHIICNHFLNVPDVSNRATLYHIITQNHLPCGCNFGCNPNPIEHERTPEVVAVMQHTGRPAWIHRGHPGDPCQPAKEACRVFLNKPFPVSRKAPLTLNKMAVSFPPSCEPSIY